MAIGERLGNQTLQRIRQCTLEEATQLDCEQPNCLILTCEQPKPRLFGIPDKAFAHLDGREKMITKMPIRLLSLSLLNLRERSHFWDIGFCTGSVSIEAKTQFPHLHIEAFEIREAGRPLMEENVRRFHTPGIETHIGDFLEADLTSLAAPDAVFIGGHGGKLIEIVERVTQRISPKGVIVFNSVSETSQTLFREAIQRVDWHIETESRMALDDFNPITLFKAIN